MAAEEIHDDGVIPAVERLMRDRVDAGPLDTGAKEEVLNVDEEFHKLFALMLDLKRRSIIPASRIKLMLEIGGGEEGVLTEEPTVVISECAFGVPECLDSIQTIETRLEAMTVLARLSAASPGQLAQPPLARALVQRLDDEEREMRAQAVTLLHILEAHVLVAYADEFASRLEAQDAAVREACIKYLGKLGEVSPDKLTQHTQPVISRLSDSQHLVREAAVHVLTTQLRSSTLHTEAGHVSALLGMEKLDERVAVRKAAMQVLGEITPIALADQAELVLPMLEDTDAGVRDASVQLLGRLEPVTLAGHASHLLGLLSRPEESMSGTRVAASALMGKVNIQVLAQMAPEVATGLLVSSLQSQAERKFVAAPQKMQTGVAVNKAAMAFKRKGSSSNLDVSAEEGVETVKLES